MAYGLPESLIRELIGSIFEYPRSLKFEAVARDSLDYDSRLAVEICAISDVRADIGDGYKYKDGAFPSTQNSIDNTNNNLNDMFARMLKKNDDKKADKWISIEDIPNARRDTVFTPPPRIGDFAQGNLGNCWQVAALGCLINSSPEYLQKILPDRDFRSEVTRKLFWTMLCIDGKWKSIRVDDQFPSNSDGRLVFTRALNHQLYAPIIEKSLAKYFKSYHGLQSRHAAEAFSMFTGNPVYYFDEKDKQSILRIIEVCLEKGFLVSVSTAKERRILESNHSYGIFDMNAEGIKLWNPWAKKEEKLDESSKSYDARTRCTNDSDGEFWIRKQTFVDWFDDIEICKFQPKANVVRFDLQLPQSVSSNSYFPLFKFETQKSQFIDLTFYQPLDQKKKLKYDIAIFQLDSRNCARTVSKTSSNGRSIFSCCKFINQGKYLFAVLGLAHSEYSSLVMAVQGLEKFQISKIGGDSHLLADMFIDLAVSTSEANKWTDKAIQYSCSVGPFVCNVAVNLDPKLCLMLTSKPNNDPKESVSYRGNANSSYDIIPPESAQITILIGRIETEKAFTWSFSFSYSMEDKNCGYGADKQKINEDTRTNAYLFRPRRMTARHWRSIQRIDSKSTENQFLDSLWTEQYLNN